MCWDAQKEHGASGYGEQGVETSARCVGAWPFGLSSFEDLQLGSIPQSIGKGWLLLCELFASCEERSQLGFV